MDTDYSKQHFDKELAIKNLKEQVYNDTLHMLKTEDRFVNYFSGYNSKSVEIFTEFYATLKSNWIENEERGYNRDFFKDKWRKACHALLALIYQKKVFNLMCRWASGEMDLAGIETSGDLIQIALNPTKSPYLEPISQAEFDTFYKYLGTIIGNYEHFIDTEGDIHNCLGFYLYSKLTYPKGQENEHYRYHEWFKAYDDEFGTGHLKDLHMIRLELEHDYMDLWHTRVHPLGLTEEQRAYHVPKISWREVKAMREIPGEYEKWSAQMQKFWEEKRKLEPPSPVYYSIFQWPVMDKIVNAIEDREVIKKYMWYRHDRKLSDEIGEINHTIYELLNYKELIPVAKNESWQAGLKDALEQFDLSTIYNTLPHIYQEYHQAISTGKEYQLLELRSFAHWTPGAIIPKVRKHLGEPENFDFLKKENLPQ